MTRSVWTTVNMLKEKVKDGQWLQDKGTFLLIGVVPIVATAGAVFGLWKISHDPDATIYRSSRESTLRGTLQNQVKKS